MQYLKLRSVGLFLLLVNAVLGSHYRGGTISYGIRAIPLNITSNNEEILVRITQRHSWRRSHHFCNNTNPSSGDIIGEGMLETNSTGSNHSAMIPYIDGKVRCTDYNAQFDYSSGEESTDVVLPLNEKIEYLYRGCCWITLLPPDSESDWSLKLVVNTIRRLNGRLNNSPRTAMNPIVQVQIGQIHVIRIPMADSDGDPVRCRWGKSLEECGSICAPKGFLRSNPCELVYNASQIGYQAVSLVIEDFDSNHTVLSAIPLQFLIHIVIKTNDTTCTDPPVYIGEWTHDSCIGIESNTTFTTNIQIRIPCNRTSITLANILTVSPPGLIRGNITRDWSDRNLYTMPIQWTPTSDQYGIHQVCFTPVDSEQRTGSQVCLTFQVDIRPPEFVLMTPMGLVSPTQSSWTIRTDRDIVRPKRSSGVYIRFFKRSNHTEVYRVNVATDVRVLYQSRQITFFTRGYTWEQNEDYYILLDSGIATLNESCGVESARLNNPHAWTFRVAVVGEMITTAQLYPITTEQIQVTRPTISSSRPTCPQWRYYDSISNESTNANTPNLTFCFTVATTFADVTIAANTWVSCMKWKLSGTADPLIELYSEPDNEFLAQNDDGNNLPFQNCYAAVLSYRLPKGDYRVVIRNPKCAYGKFELRFIAEINRELN